MEPDKSGLFGLQIRLRVSELTSGRLCFDAFYFVLFSTARSLGFSTFTAIRAQIGLEPRDPGRPALHLGTPWDPKHETLSLQPFLNLELAPVQLVFRL